MSLPTRKLMIAVALLLAVAVPASAAPAYSTWKLGCDQARAIVARSGAVVMYTAPASSLGPATYERFVANSGFCDPHETTEPGWARTSDAAQCPILYRCVTRFDDFPRFRGR